MSEGSMMSAWAVREQLRSGAVRARDVLERVLANIGDREDEVRAYLNLEDADALRARADEADRALAAGGDPRPLLGLPTSVKDNLCTRSLPTTCASRMLEHFASPYAATATARAEAAGAIVVGKTNMDEFAMGCSTENSAFGPTRNPFDPSRVPGGTSGGATASVAAGEAALALGSDTGGSIRQPASFCGVVGIKPTYGRVSRFGLVAYASSFDQVGAIGADVRSAAMLLAPVTGHDPHDSTAIPAPPLDPAALDAPLEGRLRFGVPEAYLGEGVQAEVAEAVEESCRLLEAAGHQRVDVVLPDPKEAIAAYYLITAAEASSNLARYDGVRYGHRAAGTQSLTEMYERSRSEGFGPEVKKRILLGTFVLSAGYQDEFYNQARKVRTLIRQRFDRVYEEVDVVVHPVAPTTAYPLGSLREDPLAQYLGDAFSVTANLVGMPAASVPAGRDAAGLPIGVQVAAPVSEDVRLVRAAAELERVLAEAGRWESPSGL